MEDDVVLGHEFDQVSGALVFQNLEFWLETSDGEVLVDALMIGSHGFSCSIFEGLCKDGVGIVVIYDEDVFVAQCGPYWEFTC